MGLKILCEPSKEIPNHYLPPIPCCLPSFFFFFLLTVAGGVAKRSSWTLPQTTFPPACWKTEGWTWFFCSLACLPWHPRIWGGWRGLSSRRSSREASCCFETTGGNCVNHFAANFALLCGYCFGRRMFWSTGFDVSGMVSYSSAWRA